MVRNICGLKENVPMAIPSLSLFYIYFWQRGGKGTDTFYLYIERMASSESELPNSNKTPAMVVEAVLHMKQGLGESSYAQNSCLQRKSMEALKHVVVQSAVEFYSSETPRTLALADLGCSSGPNALLMAERIIDAVARSCREASRPAPDFTVFLNDLPTSDFNTVFVSVPDFVRKVGGGRDDGDGGGRGLSVFVAGTPGSFYGRLFANSSLHFVSSCYSLHWLSEVPSGLLDEEGIPMNKGKMFISRTSPPAVLRSYYEQFQKDFGIFLKSRSEELVPGGRVAVAMLGRKTDDFFADKNTTFLWDILSQSLANMASQKLVEEEKVDSYNVPFYSPSMKEVEIEVQKEGSFLMEYIQVYEMSTSTGDVKMDAMLTSMHVRAIQESMITHHFGGHIIDTLFEQYSTLLSEAMAKEEITGSHLLIVLKKKP